MEHSEEMKNVIRNDSDSIRNQTPPDSEFEVIDDEIMMSVKESSEKNQIVMIDDVKKMMNIPNYVSTPKNKKLCLSTGNNSDLNLNLEYRKNAFETNTEFMKEVSQFLISLRSRLSFNPNPVLAKLIQGPWFLVWTLNKDNKLSRKIMAKRIRKYRKAKRRAKYLKISILYKVIKRKVTKCRFKLIKRVYNLKKMKNLKPITVKCNPQNTNWAHSVELFPFVRKKNLNKIKSILHNESCKVVLDVQDKTKPVRQTPKKINEIIHVNEASNSSSVVSGVMSGPMQIYTQGQILPSGSLQRDIIANGSGGSVEVGGNLTRSAMSMFAGNVDASGQVYYKDIGMGNERRDYVKEGWIIGEYGQVIGVVARIENDGWPIGLAKNNNLQERWSSNQAKDGFVHVLTPPVNNNQDQCVQGQISQVNSVLERGCWEYGHFNSGNIQGSRIDGQVNSGILQTGTSTGQLNTGIVQGGISFRQVKDGIMQNIRSPMNTNCGIVNTRASAGQLNLTASTPIKVNNGVMQNGMPQSLDNVGLVQSETWSGRVNSGIVQNCMPFRQADWGGVGSGSTLISVSGGIVHDNNIARPNIDAVASDMSRAGQIAAPARQANLGRPSTSRDRNYERVRGTDARLDVGVSENIWVGDTVSQINRIANHRNIMNNKMDRLVEERIEFYRVNTDIAIGDIYDDFKNYKDKISMELAKEYKDRIVRIKKRIIREVEEEDERELNLQVYNLDISRILDDTMLMNEEEFWHGD